MGPAATTWADTIVGVEQRRRGRPRAAGPSPSGLGTEEDILRAAAELFSTRGFGQSTYAICKRAGVTQASMYHYFANKHEILVALLLRTVSPSVEFAERLGKRAEPAEVRLWSLCSFDAGLFADSELNIGLLMLLPEVADPEVDAFRVERDRLIAVYRGLIAECGAVTSNDVDELTAMIVALIESVVLIRRQDPAVQGQAVSNRIADTALGLVGVSATKLRTLRASGRRVRDEIRDELAYATPA